MARNEQRKPLAMAAHVRSVRTELELSLADISTTGCRVIGVLNNIAPGQMITIRPEGLGELIAAVIWIRDGEAGLEFDFPLHPEVVEVLGRIYPPNNSRLSASLAA